MQKSKKCSNVVKLPRRPLTGYVEVLSQVEYPAPSTSDVIKDSPIDDCCRLATEHAVPVSAPSHPSRDEDTAAEVFRTGGRRDVGVACWELTLTTSRRLFSLRSPEADYIVAIVPLSS